MARRRSYVPLNVFLNGRLVGVLRRGTSGAVDFHYEKDWLAWENAFPISLSLPLREDRYIGAPVINVFDNLLPDNDAIRRRIAERVGADGIDAYSMLLAVGHDCVGALQFLPEGSDPGRPGNIHGQTVSDDEIAALLRNLGGMPLGMDAAEDFRISIAGVQEKTALLRRNGRWYKPAGTTATTHILKPQIGQLPSGIDLSNSVENEYFCLKFLRALGLPVAAAEMEDFDDCRTLIVERFDRRWTRDDRLLRLPQEDCCQALSVPPTRKYQADSGPGMRDILELLRGSDTPDADIATFMRAQIVFWLIGATDGHAKNFSLFLGPGGRYHLTPLYDVLSAQPSFYAGQIQRRQLRLAMSAGSNRHYAVDEIMPRHFLQTAESAGIGMAAVKAVFSDLAENAQRAFDTVVQTLPPGFPGNMIEAIQQAIAQRLRGFDES